MDNTRRQLSFDELIELVEKAEGWARDHLDRDVLGNQLILKIVRYRRKDGAILDIGRDSAGRAYTNRGDARKEFEPFLEGDPIDI